MICSTHIVQATTISDIKEKAIKVDTGKGNTIKVTMSYGEQSTLEELLIAYLGQEIAGGSAA